MKYFILKLLFYFFQVAGKFILNSCVAVHLNNNEDKYNLLAYMAAKLIALVKVRTYSLKISKIWKRSNFQNECAPETPDNPQFQEAAISGHILLLVVRERMENILGMVRRKIEFLARKKKDYTMNSWVYFFTFLESKLLYLKIELVLKHRSSLLA